MVPSRANASSLAKACATAAKAQPAASCRFSTVGFLLLKAVAVRPVRRRCRRAAGADRRRPPPGRRRAPATADRPGLAHGRGPFRRRPSAGRERRCLPMTFQSPSWLLALLVIAALVAFYVVLQLRRK